MLATSGLAIACGSSDEAGSPSLPAADAAADDAAPEAHDAAAEADDAVAEADEAAAEADAPPQPDAVAPPDAAEDGPCIPKTCGQLGASCGQLSDGCTSVIDCGWCEAPESCGGGGVSNQCGCACSLPNAVTACAAGICSLVSCETGWDDCNGDPADGCEVDVKTDPNNCGGCLVFCGGNCYDGNCTCSQCGTDCCTILEYCCPGSEVCVKQIAQCEFIP